MTDSQRTIIFSALGFLCLSAWLFLFWQFYEGALR